MPLTRRERRARLAFSAQQVCRLRGAQRPSAAIRSMANDDAVRISTRRTQRCAAILRLAHCESFRRTRPAVARVTHMVLFSPAHRNRPVLRNGAEIPAGRISSGDREKAKPQRPGRRQGPAACLRARATTALPVPSLDRRVESAAHAGGDDAAMVRAVAPLLRRLAQER